jgi:hypothetical protein
VCALRRLCRINEAVKDEKLPAGTPLGTEPNCLSGSDDDTLYWVDRESRMELQGTEHAVALNCFSRLVGSAVVAVISFAGLRLIHAPSGRRRYFANVSTLPTLPLAERGLGC